MEIADYIILLLFLASLNVRGVPLPDTFRSLARSLAPRDNSAGPPKDAIIVRQNTTDPKECPTINKALEILATRTGAQSIYIYRGLYEEQLVIDYEDGPLVIQGETSNILTYEQNTVTIRVSVAANVGAIAESATLNLMKDQFSMYNINLVNDHGTDTALALSAQGYSQGFYGCSFSSFQHTLRASRGIQLYSRCYIEGAVDFIFSGDVTAWFESTTIGVKAAASQETITASRRDDAESRGYLLFNRATITSKGAKPGTAYLGRPWEPFARVVFQNSEMSDVINSDGWIGWSEPDDPRTEHATFQEYNNHGPGSTGKRKYTQAQSSAYFVNDILGQNHTEWVNLRYLP